MSCALIISQGRFRFTGTDYCIVVLTLRSVSIHLNIFTLVEELHSQLTENFNINQRSLAYFHLQQRSLRRGCCHLSLSQIQLHCSPLYGNNRLVCPSGSNVSLSGSTWMLTFVFRNIQECSYFINQIWYLVPLIYHFCWQFLLVFVSVPFWMRSRWFIKHLNKINRYLHQRPSIIPCFDFLDLLGSTKTEVFNCDECHQRSALSQVCVIVSFCYLFRLQTTITMMTLSLRCHCVWSRIFALQKTRCCFRAHLICRVLLM